MTLQEILVAYKIGKITFEEATYIIRKQNKKFESLYDLIKVEHNRVETSPTWTKAHQEGYIKGLKRAIKELIN